MGWPSLSGIGNAVSNGWNATRDAVSSGAHTVADVATSATTTVVQGAQRAANTVVDNAHRAAAAVTTTAGELGSAARDRAVDLGRAGMDLGRRGVEAARNFDVREAAATAREGLGRATEAGRDGVTAATRWTSERVGDAADYARAHVDGDGIASQAFRGVVTAAEQNTRFSLGVTGGVVREVVGTAGAVGQLAVTATEMQVSTEARIEYGTAVVNGIADAGRATGSYLASAAEDPSRVLDDAGGALDAAGGFIGDTADRYGQAISEGRLEEIGMDVGTVATYVVPVGGGPARGALTAGVRAGTEVTVRGGAEVLARTAVREGGEALVRGGTEALATRGGAELAERGGVELAAFRDGATGQRAVAGGAADAVPAGGRTVGQAQPGAGAAARSEAGAPARLDAPGGVGGAGAAGRSIEAAAGELRQATRTELDALRAAGMGNKRIGPAISSAMDLRTGQMSRTAINGRSAGDLPANLHPTLADRLPAAREVAYERTRGAGTHSEIHAVNDLLQQGSRLEDIAVYTEQVGTQFAGTVKPPCPHCSVLLEGVNYVR